MSLNCTHWRHRVCLKDSFTHVFLSAADQVKREAGLVFPVDLNGNTSISHGRTTQTIKSSLLSSSPLSRRLKQALLNLNFHNSSDKKVKICTHGHLECEICEHLFDSLKLKQG